MAKLLSLLRASCFYIVILCSCIVVGASSHLTYVTTYFGFYFNFGALAIAAGGLSLLTTPIMLTVGAVRQGAFPSIIAFEIGWLGVLWVLFLSSGALSAQTLPVYFPYGCSVDYWTDRVACHEIQSILAFDFIAWIVLLGYTITLIVVASISSGPGRNAWTMTLSQVEHSRRTHQAKPPFDTTTSVPQLYPQPQSGIPLSPIPTNGHGLVQQHQPQNEVTYATRA